MGNGLALGWELSEELRDGAAGAGIDGLGSDFVEGNEDEGALGEARVRDLKTIFADDEIAVEDEVEIESARTVENACRAIAAEVALDCKQSVKQLVGSEMGFKRDDGVEEARLIGETDGSGGVERGAGGDATKGGKALDGGGERSVGRAGGAGKVGAKGNVGGHTGTRLARLRVGESAW